MEANYVFISADYTLLAPATGHDLLDDIKDLFCYLQKDLNGDLKSNGSDISIDPSAMVVSGTSAGGLCAYLAALHAIPKPKGVLSMYGQGGDLLVSRSFGLNIVGTLTWRSKHIVMAIPISQIRAILSRPRNPGP